MRFDLNSLKQEFSLQPGFVIHAGASTCQERNEYRANDFEPVFWIEALTDVASKAKTILLDFPKQEVVVATLWSASGEEISFHRASNAGMSSSVFKMKIHRALHPGITQKSPETHITSTLDNLLQSKGVEGKVALLVLDLQGAELAVLKGATETLANTQAIFTEVSSVEMYADQALFGDVHEFLKSHGFELVLHDLVSTGVMGDALYVARSHVARFGLVPISLGAQFPRLDLTFKSRIRYLLIRLGVPSNWLTRRKK